MFSPSKLHAQAIPTQPHPADNQSVLPAILNPRHKSLVRGNLLVLTSFVAAFFLSGFPHNRATPYLVIPTLLAIVGTADTVRCIRRRWSFYHAGVILCIYMDLMAVTLILVFLLYPYALWMTGTH
jgi:hypothetical protein